MEKKYFVDFGDGMYIDCFSLQKTVIKNKTMPLDNDEKEYVVNCRQEEERCGRNGAYDGRKETQKISS